MVWGPQLRAVARRSAVSASSNSRDGSQFPFGGCSPVSSTASSFRTFCARTLSFCIGPGARLAWTLAWTEPTTGPRRPADRLHGSDTREASPDCGAARWSLPSPAGHAASGRSASRGQDRRFRAPATVVCRAISLAEPASLVLTKTNIYRDPICFHVIIFVVRPKTKLTEGLHKQCLGPRATRGCDVPGAAGQRGRLAPDRSCLRLQTRTMFGGNDHD
jgi:hypothetical protein